MREGGMGEGEADSIEALVCNSFLLFSVVISIFPSSLLLSFPHRTHSYSR